MNFRAPTFDKDLTYLRQDVQGPWVKNEVELKGITSLAINSQSKLWH